jgi:hypothetical protein
MAYLLEKHCIVMHASTTLLLIAHVLRSLCVLPTIVHVYVFMRFGQHSGSMFVMSHYHVIDALNADNISIILRVVRHAQTQKCCFVSINRAIM